MFLVTLDFESSLFEIGRVCLCVRFQQLPNNVFFFSSLYLLFILTRDCNSRISAGCLAQPEKLHIISESWGFQRQITIRKRKAAALNIMRDHIMHSSVAQGLRLRWISNTMQNPERLDIQKPWTQDTTWQITEILKLQHKCIVA